MQKKLLILLTVLTLFLTTPVHAAFVITGGGISANAANVESASAVTTITVNKADTATVKKIHKKLAAGAAITLKVKGNAAAADNLLKQVMHKIKKVNKLGVIFEYKKGKSANGYTTYTVDSENAGVYMYAVKFINKLYSLLKEELHNTESYQHYIADMELYPDETTRKLRWAYDYIVKNKYKFNILVSEQDRATVAEDSYEQPVTQSDVRLHYDNLYNSLELDRSLTQSVNYHYTLEAYFDETLYQERTRKSEYDFDEKLTEDALNALMKAFMDELKDSGYEDYSLAATLQITARGYTFDEFCKLPIAQKLAGKITSLDVMDASTYLLYTCEDFCDLSDAMKVYAIAKSQYFACNYKRPKYGMIYEATHNALRGKAAMKALYKNKAAGVCSVYASYECCVWKSLDMQCYWRSNSAINHAWSVVVAENSVGKKLWIPFDYGIGPSASLNVSKEVRNKYLKTERMRYKLYLANIKGAPKKKNFTEKDFK